MTNNEYYKAIFKRKSFHLFRNVGDEKLTARELEDIKDAYISLMPLYPQIKTAIRVIPAKDVNFKRDAEYCILIYSENKENYLMNVGYIGEQLDLYLVSHNIGSLWFGIGKPDIPKYEGLDYVIMIAIHKISDEKLYRKDMFKSKRKNLDQIWSGDTLGVAEIARFAPSACNTQPWIVKNSDDKLTVYRYKKPGLRGIMPVDKVGFYNRIDIGIFLFFLEVCLTNEKYSFEKVLYIDDALDNEEKIKVAEYTISYKD